MPDYESMSLEQLQAEGDRVEGLIADLRKESRARASVMDRKLRLVPIIPTDRDQVIVAPSVRAMLQSKIPAALFEQIKGFLPEDK
jgi:hypothetical protein